MMVSMLFQKWTRSDLDVKAGKKGAAFYWDEVAKLFNDKSYVLEFLSVSRKSVTASRHGFVTAMTVRCTLLKGGILLNTQV